MLYNDYSVKEMRSEDKNFSKSLLTIADPAKRLFYRGEWDGKLFDNSLAIVGSRQMTQYGRQVIDRFMPDFVAAGVTIISGFMYGVDTYAHEACVKLGGKTVAVLAYGLDICYPAENEKLYSQILETGGIVISEYEAKSKPQLWKFPKRNRIVAALASLGVLVIEAGENSGSLITAELAQKMKKKVYAVAGNITSSSSTGTNRLIQNNNAKMVVNTRQVLGKEYKAVVDLKPRNVDDLEAKIMQTLSAENMSLDELSVSLGVDITKLMTKVSMLSLQGKVQEVNGKLYLNF